MRASAPPLSVASGVLGLLGLLGLLGALSVLGVLSVSGILGLLRADRAVAQTELCADPAGFCGQLISSDCLSRLGAGAVAAAGAACASQIDDYRACVASAAECATEDGAGAAGEGQDAPRGSCSEAIGRELWAIAADDNTCASYAAYLEACPGAHFAVFARSRSETLACGGDGAPAAAAAQPEPAAPAEPAADPALARSAQRELQRLGLYHGAIDGIWGAGSAEAMRRFQNQRGERADGVITEAGLGALRATAGSRAETAAADPSDGVWRGDCVNPRISDMRLTLSGASLRGQFTWKTLPNANLPFITVEIAAELGADRAVKGRYRCVENQGPRCVTFNGDVWGRFPDLGFKLSQCALRR